jgi:hypothetical protein
MLMANFIVERLNLTKGKQTVVGAWAIRFNGGQMRSNL